MQPSVMAFIDSDFMGYFFFLLLSGDSVCLLPACLWVRRYMYLSCVPASPLMTHASFFLTLYHPHPHPPLSLSSLVNTHLPPVIPFYIELREGSGTEQNIVERWQRQGKCGFSGDEVAG